MIEPFAFYLINTFGMSRKKALILIGIVVYILGMLCILSSLKSTQFGFFGMSFLICLIVFQVGYYAFRWNFGSYFCGICDEKRSFKILFEPYMRGIFFELWYVFLRFISPLAVVIVMIAAFLK